MVDDILSLDLLDFVVVYKISADIVLAEGSVTQHVLEDGLLARFGIVTGFQHVGDGIFDGFLRDFRVVEDVLHDGHGLLHVLAETVDIYVGVFVAETDGIGAGKVVHLPVDLAQRAVFALQLVEEIVGDAGFLVVKSTIVVTID